MKKYFIVLILGLFLGVCFARSAYGQENYFTPGLTMKALQDDKENSKGEKVKGSHNFYYKQYTYPAYIEGLDDFETKYVLYLRSTKYEDVEVTLTYVQPHFVYSDTMSTTQSILVLLNCIKDNIEQIQGTIDYCNEHEYEKSVKETLGNLIGVLVQTHEYIRDCALSYIDYREKEDFAYCIKELLNIEVNYWQLYTALAQQNMQNSEGYTTITFTYTEKE